jgi:hypothetical protein
VLLGKTYGGLMIDVRPTNAKLWARAVRIVTSLTGLSDEAALKLIQKAGGRAKVALVMHHAGVSLARARDLLVEHKGSLRSIVGDLEQEHGNDGRRASSARSDRGRGKENEADDDDEDEDEDDDHGDDDVSPATAKGA